MAVYQSLGQRQAQEAAGWVQDEMGNWTVPGSAMAKPGQLAWHLGAPATSSGIEDDPESSFNTQTDTVLRGLQQAGMAPRPGYIPTKDPRLAGLRKQADAYAQQKYPGA